MHMRDIVMSGVSVRLSACLAHAGIESKVFRITLGSHGFHRWVAQRHQISDTKFPTRGHRETPLQWFQMTLGR